MSAPAVAHRRVLAIHPASRSFGYALLESPTTLVDWGVKATRTDKAMQTTAKVAALLAHYAPDILVVEDCRAEGSRRRRRVVQLLAGLRAFAVLKGLRACAISKQQVRQVFSSFDARSREQIAAVLAEKFPELAPRLPRHRKAYETDDYQMAMFAAVALAFAYFRTRRARSRAPAPLST